jgi:5-formyltetrahydrofolate cyclo-ligase
LLRDALRSLARQRREGLCSGDSRSLSQAAQAHLFGLAAYREARRLLVYVAAPGEVHTSGILEDALRRGVELYTPVVHRAERRLAMRRLKDLAELEPGPYGIGHVAGGEDGDPAVLECAVVPGVAFDPAGNRLGRGGGYFDRFLSGLQAVRIGLAFRCQVLPHIPAEPWDVPMHYVVTEAGVLDCSRVRSEE